MVAGLPLPEFQAALLALTGDRGDSCDFALENRLRRRVYVAVGGVEAIEGKVRELSEAERIWESGASRLRALRLDLGARLFAALDGPARRLVRALADAGAADRPPHLVLRFRADAPVEARPPRALRWRWETLQGPESGSLFGGRGLNAPQLTLQLGAAELADARPLPTRCLRVLFMASSPLATEPVLDFENEEERLLAAVAPFVDEGRVRFDVVEDGTLEARRSAASRPRRWPTSAPVRPSCGRARRPMRRSARAPSRSAAGRGQRSTAGRRRQR